jgi:orotidine-5'-phosphate decarboxylase
VLATDRLIVALDVETLAEADRLAAQLEGVVSRLKVGLELFSACGPEAVRMAQRHGARVMLDLKLHDIPETVARAASRAASLGVDLLTVHTAGGKKMLEAAAEALARSGLSTRLLGVTVLTSLDDQDLADVGVGEGVEAAVLRRARLAVSSGLHGVVASPLEAARIRQVVPPDFLIVTPGVRPQTVAAGDQKRIATPAAARAAGADCVVVGRPIRDAESPRAAAEAILRELAQT